MEIPAYKEPSYTYRAKVVHVVDGDTIDVQIDVGFKTFLHKRLRLLGIDTWEVRGEEREKGLIAKDRVVELTLNKDVLVQTVMDGEGKYGRVLAWIWIPTDQDPLCLNSLLLEEGHGTEY